MKVLFDCQTPSVLAHGGQQIQAVNTVNALREIGVDADFVRWWDPAQQGDVLHFFGRMSRFYSGLARDRGLAVVVADLLAAQTTRNALERLPHWGLRQLDRLTGGKIIAPQLGWEGYRTADACVALTTLEAEFMRKLFGAPAERMHVVPNGVEEEFFLPPETGRGERKNYLLCTATVVERKRVRELAAAAAAARVPLRVVGKPYAESAPYYQEVLALQRRHPDLIFLEGHVDDRERLALLYWQARGFVLLSTAESLSLSALEAAAAQCPLLLSDLPWARCVFGNQASYSPITDDVAVTTRVLRAFYDEAASRPLPPKPLTWREVARQLKAIYEKILARRQPSSG